MSLTIVLAFAAQAATVERGAAELTVHFANLRNRRGVVHACLTREPRYFPDCRGDPRALRATVPASERTIHFEAIPAGHYAITLFHDENRNQRLDMMIGVPREGFGFSGNPRIRFGAPKFWQVTIKVPAGESGQTVRMQYLL